jgi:NAD(P)-dependent dehydrogenase (short-subunit alcohol dehydrogenase family)
MSVQPYTTVVCAAVAESNIFVSEYAYPPGTPYQVHVSAAKAAVDATSAVLAVEEGPHGVRSNVIAPGVIAGTEGDDRLSPKDPTRQNHLAPSLRSQGRFQGYRQRDSFPAQ